MSYHELGAAATVLATPVARQNAFQTKAIAQINAANSNLAVLLKPLHPAIDRAAAIPATYRAQLKTRPLDALFELFRPVESLAKDTIIEVQKSSLPDGGKGSFVRTVGFPGSRVVVDMRTAVPEDAIFPETTRNWIQRARMIAQFMICVVHAPLSTSAALLKLTGQRFLGGVGAVVTDAQILAPVVALDAQLTAAMIPEVLTAAVVAGRENSLFKLASDTEKAASTANANSAITSAGRAAATAIGDKAKASTKTIATAVGARSVAQSLGKNITEAISNAVRNGPQPPPPPAPVQQTVNNVKNFLGLRGFDNLPSLSGYGEDHSFVGLGDGGATPAAAGGVAAQGAATGGGTTAATVTTAEVSGNTVAPEVLKLIMDLYKTANETGLTKEVVAAAADTIKNPPELPGAPGGEAATASPPGESGSGAALLGVAAVGIGLYLWSKKR